MVTQPGIKNPNWKGGRTVASNGYVLVKVPTDHHLADSRGYAYEHRVNAEVKIGRPLRDGDRVKFRNGDHTDTRPENLIVVARVPDEVKKADRVRRATLRKRGVETISADLKDDLTDFFEGTCAYCGGPIEGFDHIVPVVWGGKTERGNMLPACGFCNGSKHSRNVVEWIEAKRVRVSIQTLEFLAFHGHFDEQD